MLYTKEQKMLEKCFYVVRGGKVIHSQRDYSTHPENESPLWEGGELTPNEKENRLALLAEWYATHEEGETPFSGEGLDIVRKADNAGPKHAPTPKKYYDRETVSLSPMNEGVDE